MVIGYGVIALISLCMVGVCVLSDKKRDIWLLLVFVSVSMCNLGYFMLGISRDLSAALNSNRISYLGSVFLPFFMLMMVLRFCGIRRSRFLTVSLVAVGVVMLAITTSPGVLPIYYSSVDIAFTEQGTKLIREYGPLHLAYYVYLFGYMSSMIAVAIYAILKKRIKSRSHTALLLCAVLCNIVIWLIEQVLPRGFEWLSLSYVLTECLMLVIYRSMQRQGLMDRQGKTQSYTINVLLTVYLLLFANFVHVVTKETTLVLYVIAQVVVLIIYVGILVAWGASLYDRIVDRSIRKHLLCLVGLMILWILLRTLRHTVFLYIFPYGQWCWYAYYIPMILIPQFCLLAAKHIGKEESWRLNKAWYLLYIPSVLLILGILTNDVHQLAFRFTWGYEAGWDIYERGILHHLATAWIFACIVLAVVEIFRRCRLPDAHRIIWLPVTMLGIGAMYSVLYAVQSDLFGFVEITIALCFTVVAIWESSIKVGLIQSNTYYDELLRQSGLGVTVADNSYAVHYRSDDAVRLTIQQIRQAENKPVMLDKGLRVCGSKIRGGYALWQEDISELTDILEELSELREELKDSNEVSVQNYQMDKRIRMLAERNRLHDELHRQTSGQIGLLDRWLTAFTQSEDEGERRELLRRIVVVCAYLKRRNNLFLVSEQEGTIKAGELDLSVREMVRNLHYAGVKCACLMQIEGEIPSDVAMRLFDFYEYVVENSFDGLRELLARFFCRDGKFYCCVDAVCTMDLRKLQGGDISVSETDDHYYTLSFKAEGGEGR